MKRKYNCPHCNNTSVLKEKDIKICLTRGFQTMTTYKDGVEQYETMKQTAPKIVKKLTFYDKKLEQYWVPTILNIPDKGMIFPEGNELDWEWSFAPIITIPLFERIKYPIPGKKDEFYETRLGIELIEHFDKFEFSTAAKKVGYNPNNV